MSAVVLITVVLPAASTVAWPVITAAAASAAGVMGFSAVVPRSRIKGEIELELPVKNPELVPQEVYKGQDIVFEKEGIRITISSDDEGRMKVRVAGKGRTEEQLNDIGTKMLNGMIQQYAYNRIVNEIQENEYNLVAQQMEDDGTVRLYVRVTTD